MTAFVRFRALDEGDGRGPLHVAWFEPEHHIVEATAPFFARRFTAMRWAILTPERSVHWDGERPGLRPGRAPRPGAAGRCRRGALAHLLPQHLQSGAAEAGDDEAGDAQEVLGQPARGGADRSARGGRGRTKPGHGPARPSDPARRIPRAPQPTPGREPTPGGEAPSSLPALREALERCRECPIGEHATQAVPGEGLEAREADVRRRAAGRPGRPAGQALRRPGRPALRPGPGRARHRPPRRLRHQRGQALQVRAARQAPHPQDAGAAGGGRLPALARERDRAGRARPPWWPWARRRHGS